MFCPVCGKQSAPNANFCSACGAAAAPAAALIVQPRIVRPRAPRMIAGICSGVAIHFGWDIALTRILLSVFTILTSGLGLLVYLAAWIILPEAQFALPAVTTAYPAPRPAAAVPQAYTSGFDSGQGTSAG